jgi:hypothetical protein
MDMVASAVGMYLLIALGAWSLAAGFAGAFAHKKTNNLGVSAIAGLTPLLLAWALMFATSMIPDKPQVSVINGKTYTAETLPPLTIGSAQIPPTDDPKNLDMLQAFGIDAPAIELCRKRGCRVDFTSTGGIANFGPLRSGDWQYTLDPATEKWKLKE